MKRTITVLAYGLAQGCPLYDYKVAIESTPPSTHDGEQFLPRSFVLPLLSAERFTTPTHPFIERCADAIGCVIHMTANE